MNYHCFSGLAGLRISDVKSGSFLMSVSKSQEKTTGCKLGCHSSGNQVRERGWVEARNST